MHRSITKNLVTLTAVILSAVPAIAQNNKPIDTTAFTSPIKVTCVGDSITQGSGAKISWPSQLSEMLGDKWKVSNFGVSGATLMNKGDKPYQKLQQYQSALTSSPDVVIIMLGTNDTKPHNWKHFASDYENDYREMVEKFSKLESKPRIFICHPPYIAKNGNFGINNENTKAQMPVIEKIAKSMDLGIINIYAALEGQDECIPDKVHPNTEGAGLIAKAVCKSLTGKPAPLPAIR